VDDNKGRLLWWQNGLVADFASRGMEGEYWRRRFLRDDYEMSMSMASTGKLSWTYSETRWRRRRGGDDRERGIIRRSRVII
jgi:hypothetical protein